MKIELIEIIDKSFPMNVDEECLEDIGITKHKNKFNDYPYTAKIKVDDEVMILGCFMPGKESDAEEFKELMKDVERQIELGENKLFFPNAYISNFQFNEVLRNIPNATNAKFFFYFENSVLSDCYFDNVKFRDKTCFKHVKFGDKTSF